MNIHSTRLLASVFITSFATMAFEMVGARMVAPYLGNSIEIWGGIIATVLGGMTLGYWGGGHAADRYPNREHLAGVIFISGIFVVLTWTLRDVLLTSIVSWSSGSLSISALSAGIFLFFPAAVFLGSVSPFVTKLLLADISTSARTVGLISAIGTLGAISGTLVSSAWLIPSFGTSILLGSIATLLLLTSFIVDTKWLWWQRVIGGTLFLTGAYTTTTTVEHLIPLLTDRDTSYSRIWIYEQTNPDSGTSTRLVRTDPYGTQCASFVHANTVIKDELVFVYTNAFTATLDLIKKPLDVLVIGGCNYSFPEYILKKTPARVDVVEIDSGMTQLAKDFFDLSNNPRLTITHEDARRFINRHQEYDKRYDLIFTDAFNSYSAIPHHLTTQQALRGISDMLHDTGIVAMNLIGSIEGPFSDFVRAEITTVQSVFPHVRVFQIQQTPRDALQNILVVAGKSSKVLTQQISSPPRVVLTEINIATLTPGLILTDDYAPVERLTRAGRNFVLNQ